jgi:glucan phosphorylase
MILRSIPPVILPDPSHDALSLQAQKAVDIAYADKAGWAKKSILSTAGSGKFSSGKVV